MLNNQNGQDKTYQRVHTGYTMFKVALFVFVILVIQNYIGSL